VGAGGWTAVRIPGKSLTQYGPVNWQGAPAWQADSQASASMWRHPVDLPAELVGEVSFSWWVDRLVAGADLRAPGMGDSPARLVFAFDGDKGRLSLKDRMLFDVAEALTGEAPPYATLMYVWSNQVPPETVILHPRSDRIRKVVVEQGPDGLRQWRHYRRNLAQDFQRAFGEPSGRLLAVALMTDSDNMASSARTWYGDVTVQGLPPLGGPVTPEPNHPAAQSRSASALTKSQR
jgi:hypothetical protein